MDPRVYIVDKQQSDLHPLPASEIQAHAEPVELCEAHGKWVSKLNRVYILSKFRD